MPKTPDGGPAFPDDMHIGMTLRDYFAAHALTGYLAMHSDNAVLAPETAFAVTRAYEYADAMLAEREK